MLDVRKAEVRVSLLGAGTDAAHLDPLSLGVVGRQGSSTVSINR
jgi:hypothetical protein